MTTDAKRRDWLNARAAGAVALILAAVAACWFVAARGHRRPHQHVAAHQADAAATAALRKHVLTGSATELHVTPIGGVWGVAMEIGYPVGFASVVALADGTANLYLSTGGGIAGEASNAAAKQAAIDLCTVAGTVAKLTPTVDFPAPAAGRVRFYVLTTDGVRTAEEAQAVLAAGRSALSPLFLAAQAVLTQLRLASEADD